MGGGPSTMLKFGEVMGVSDGVPARSSHYWSASLWDHHSVATLTDFDDETQISLGFMWQCVNWSRRYTFKANSTKHLKN